MKPAWTLFLDRDGVINRRCVGGYITQWSEFRFEKGVLEFLAAVNPIFEHIVVVTNQQGVAKGLMTQNDLDSIHDRMLTSIAEQNGRIDHVFACTCLASQPENCRKPSPKMAQQAKQSVPSIDFSRSMMIGDSVTDMQFGHHLGMKTIFIHNQVDTKSEDLKWIKEHCWVVLDDMIQAQQTILDWHDRRD